MSDIVKPGPWQLRFVIVNREDDFLLYLTNNGLGKVVTVEPEDQPDRQIWFAVPVERKKDYYTIITNMVTINPVGLTRVDGSDKVILSDRPSEWRLEYVPAEVTIYKTYKIHPPPTDIIGVYYLLGKEGNEVVIQTFPVVPGNSDPAWQFEGGPVAPK